MLMRTDPVGDFDRVAQQLFNTAGTPARPGSVPMDAYRDGEMVFLHFDVPGLDPGSLGLHVQRNVLSVSGERKPSAPEHCSYIAAERASGSFSRQVFLGESLDTERIEAHYDQGVLKVSIPVRERPKPHRIEITGAATRGRN
jgi:HSP20 family protein